MSGADERPETGSTQGSFVIIGVLTIAVSLVFASTLYLMLEQGMILKNIARNITRTGSANGVVNVIITAILLLTIMITMFGLRTIIPNILADPERQENATKMLKERVIPISATIFFVLFLHQFLMGGRDVGGLREVRDKLGLILIIGLIAAIAQGIRLVMSGSSITRILLASVMGSLTLIGSFYILKNLI